MTPGATDAGAPRRLTGLLWLAAAVALSLSVLAINGVPLYYFDSVGYKLQGDSILGAILPDDAPRTAPAEAGGGGHAAAAPAAEEDNEVNVTRSPTYAVLVALGWQGSPPYALAVLNLVAVFAAAWFTARAVARATLGTGADLTLVAAPVAAAALSALPFYVAFVMPDTFAPVAILVMAALVAFSRHLTLRDLLLGFALLAFSVVVHRSHLLMVGLAVPIAVLVMLLTARRRVWTVAGLIAAAALVGVVEIGAYSTAAQMVSGKEPSFRPFLTARLVTDGPGYAYLEAHCPDAAIPTCPLAEALSRSDNPERLRAENILFERSEELGSFRLLPPEDQLRVARDQRRFFLRVLADQPLGVLGALLGNTLEQTATDGINMTVPNPDTAAFLRRTLDDPDLELGRLVADRTWIDAVNFGHSAIYLVSLAVILVTFFRPGPVTREIRIFAVFVLLGILINAFVCGAVAQPAARYGARVIWLLPFLATVMTLVALRRRAGAGQGDGALRQEPAE